MLELAITLLLIAVLIQFWQPPFAFSPAIAGGLGLPPPKEETKPWEDLLMFKKGGGSAPKADPRIGEAALKNAELGEDWLEFAREQFGVANERQTELDELTKRIGEEQLKTQDRANRWSEEDRARWEESFRPIEDRLIEDATGWDSEERLEELSAEAKAGVMSNAHAAQRQNERQMASMGIDPRSGRFAGIDRASDLSTALAAAGAQNQARSQARSQGMALRADAANMGRGLPSQAAASAGLGLQAGGMAQGGSLNAAANQRANVGIMGQGFGAAMQGYSNQANTLNQQYQNQLSAWSANQQAAGNMWGGIGQLAGTVGTMALASSEEYKTDKKQIGDSALDAVNNMPVESWKYKREAQGKDLGPSVIPPDDKTHVGTYAEDFQRETGMGDGKSIPVGDAIGVTMKAIQELDQKVERMGLPASSRPKSRKKEAAQ